jgi:uncharacterized membrane protein
VLLRRRRGGSFFLGLAVCGSLAATIATTALPHDAWARPRSGGSFSGRGGFRSGGGSRSTVPMRSGRDYGGGSNIIVVPGGGYGYSPFGGGYGYGGGFGLGNVVMLGVVGIGALVAFRAIRMARVQRLEGGGGGGLMGMLGGGGDADYAPDRAYVYKVQLGLGRSARGLQERLERFAADGDTGTESGLAQLLQQTALELLREKDSIRYGQAVAAGPLSMEKGEARMNSLALDERSRFQVERVRGADGKVRRSEVAPTQSEEVLEYLVVTLLVASRAPTSGLDKLNDVQDLDQVLRALGSIPADVLLGLDVIWTPADPDDALTEAELISTYPELRSL